MHWNTHAAFSISILTGGKLNYGPHVLYPFWGHVTKKTKDKGSSWRQTEKKSEKIMMDKNKL